MDKDTESHPSARLVSIGKPMFWIYWIVCLLLYVVNYLFTNPSPGKLRTTGVSALILVCIFVALTLNLIESYLSNKNIKSAFNMVNKLFMVGSLVIIFLWIILK